VQIWRLAVGFLELLARGPENQYPSKYKLKTLTVLISFVFVVWFLVLVLVRPIGVRVVPETAIQIGICQKRVSQSATGDVLLPVALTACSCHRIDVAVQKAAGHMPQVFNIPVW
jgi:hypothetical protein